MIVEATVLACGDRAICYNVVSAGLNQHMTDVPDCRIRSQARALLLPRCCELEQRRSRVVTHAHRRRSGVIGRAEKLDLILPHSHYTSDDAECGARGVEHRPLLDMQFQISHVLSWCEPRQRMCRE